MAKAKTFHLLIITVGIFCFGVFSSVLASTTNGTIDATDKYAWSENAGWINFGSTEGDVHITDLSLTGYAWTENFGWISLNCSNDTSCAAVDYKVANDGNGNLSGYAYGEDVGWINFAPTGGGVTINNSGEFQGYAWGENTGWIMFNCLANASCATVDFKVKTDYRPQNARPSSTPVDNYPVGGGSSGAAIGQGEKSDSLTNIKNQTDQLFERVNELTKEISMLPGKIVEFFKPPEEQPETPIIAPPIEETVKPEAPLSLKGEWGLISSDLADNFVLSPLPADIQELADKLPQIKDAFNELGISNFSDMEKLRGVDITLPNLVQVLATRQTQLNAEQIYSLLNAGYLSELPVQLKEAIPEDIVFSFLAGNKLPLNPSLEVSDKGEIEQKISTFSGKSLKLVIRPEGSVEKISGYIVFKSGNPSAVRETKPGLSKILSNIRALLSSAADNAEQVGNIFVTTQFQYADPDNDGIYVADVLVPSTVGIYQIVSELSYSDNSLENKELKTTLLIDPEGYVFYKTRAGDEARIRGAKVSIYWFNPENSQYQLWEAGDFQQTNPQITDNTGRYSFFVPEGKYYLKVESSIYSDYRGEPFEVTQGTEVHQNIELKARYWWVGFFGLNIILLSVVAVLSAIIIILLLYGLRRSKTR